MSEAERLFHLVDDSTAGLRLDAALGQLFPAVSRSRWQRRIEQGAVRIDGAPVTRSKHKLLLGQRIEVAVQAPAPSSLVPEDIPLDVLFEDASLIVVNKPAGLVVHPAAGHHTGTLVNALLHHAPGMHVGDQERPGIVHRLDKDTSGVMVVAKTEAAHTHLAEQFRARAIDKRYRAYCLGALATSPLALVTGHKRHPKDRQRFFTKLPPPDEHSPPSVRRASATYITRAVRDGISALDVDLGTGRTHQIRAQLADHGHPLIGDALYGGDKLKGLLPTDTRRIAEQLTRQALHAHILRFDHPVTGARIACTAPLPDDLAALEEAICGPQK